MDGDLTKLYKSVYFVGIGGVSMSGLATMLVDKGLKVSGTDIKPSAATKKLESLGVKVNIGHRAENITDDIDLLVYTAAVNNSNPELVEAK